MKEIQKIIKCPRCLGKGYVDNIDIIRLNRESSWYPGGCVYCNGEGVVDEAKTADIPVDKVDLVNNYMPFLNDLNQIKNNDGLNEIVEGITFRSFSQFIKKTRKGCSHFIYRGHSSFKYELKSKVARKFNVSEEEESISSFLLKEKSLINFFMARAQNQVDSSSYSTWHWLALAQHYGISTRLIDWTENPLIALYFTSLSDPDEDGALFLHHTSELLDTENIDPFNEQINGFLIAPYVTNRLAAQSAIFSISSKPWEEFKSSQNDIIKCRITKKFKKELIDILPRLGINKRTVFSDLDSCAFDVDESYDNRLCNFAKNGIIFTNKTIIPKLG